MFTKTAKIMILKFYNILASLFSFILPNRLFPYDITYVKNLK